MGGRDKAFVSLAGRALIAHAVAGLEPQVDCLAVSSNSDPRLFAGLGLEVLADDTSVDGEGRRGPLAGLARALRWARDLGVDRLATAPVDSPFLPDGWVTRLCDAGRNVPIAVAADAHGTHPACALWSTRLAGEVAERLGRGERKLMQVARDLGAREVRFEAGGDPFLNINTPDDLARAETLLVQSARQ
jgi:molybdopterin-guanine dinucleotide biosynthesis protein A